MATLASLFLMVFSSFLQVMRTTIKALMSLKFDLMESLTTALPPIESKKTTRKIRCCGHTASAFSFDWIFFILAGNEDMHKDFYGFEFRSDLIPFYGVRCP